jgi:hypothetical protein
MQAQYFEGKPISDEASSVCVLFDPKDGRIAHVHGITVLHSRGGITESELEARARKLAEDFGKSVTGLKALHVPMVVFSQNETFTVNSQGDGLIPSPHRSKRNR